MLTPAQIAAMTPSDRLTALQHHMTRLFPDMATTKRVRAVAGALGVGEATVYRWMASPAKIPGMALMAVSGMQ